jgi:Helicase conserved C-terminal domain
MGTGKTRIVLRKILRGTRGRRALWNTRLKRTLIIGPNYHVKRAWWRELLLLAREQGFARELKESRIREMSVGQLNRALLRRNIAVPTYLTYQLLGHQGVRKRTWHYVVLDEWHRITHRIVDQCDRWIGGDEGGKPWYVGGRNIIKDLFFVSATPVNPVLENEEALDKEALDESAFCERVKEAIRRAEAVVQAFSGARGDQMVQFFELMTRVGVQEFPKPGSGRLKWILPRASEAVAGPPSSVELDMLRTNLTADDWSLEYAEMVGLIRTTWNRHKRFHRLSHSLSGKKTSFGKPYNVLCIVRDGRRDRPAWKFLAHQHPRCFRLIDLLQQLQILIVSADGLPLGTKRKVLIFCSHRGVALGLAETLKQMFGDDFAATNVDAEDVEQLTDDFNKRGKPPFVLVATDVLSEGIDLHRACKLLVHYELPWSPLRLFQRVGRLTRRVKSGFNKDVRIAHIIVPGSVEEERVNRLVRRVEFLSEQNLWPSNAEPMKLAKALLGSGPSLHLGEILHGSDEDS